MYESEALNFIDQIIIGLADQEIRSDIYSQETLQSIVTVAYGPDASNAVGPLSITFDEVQLAVPVFPAVALRGVWQSRGGEPIDLHLELQGRVAPLRRADAVWRGAVVVRVATPTSRIARVDVAMPDLSTIDADIAAAAGGALPSGAALESARRDRLAGRLGVAVHDTDAAIAGLLRRYGVDPLRPDAVGALLASIQAAGNRAVAALEVAYEPAPAGEPRPRALPVAAAVLVREAGFGVAETLLDSALVRDALAPHLAVKPDPAMPLRRPLIVLWIVPAATFDDASWPGPNRTARREAAAAWLAGQGVALAAV